MTSEKPLKISKEELKQKLTPEQFDICINKHNEMAFTGKYNNYKKPGIYKCVVCGNGLFSRIQSLILVQDGQVFMLR